jgi:hypothetical protein
VDLRAFNISKEMADQIFPVLDYQPFVVDGDRHTGVAYSWLHTEDARLSSDKAFQFDRRTQPADVYHTSFVANRMLAATYDTIIDAVTRRVPGGTFLDVSCNNGYFPVLASLKGCSRAVGLDLSAVPERRKSFDLLNAITGSRAQFLEGGYSFDHHLLFHSSDGRNAVALEDEFDIVTNSAFLIHTGEPLHVLAALARRAKRALLIYCGFLDEDDFIIRYNPAQNRAAPFPNCFTDGTVLTTKLFIESMRLLGFSSVERIPPPPTGIQDATPLPGMTRYGAWKAFLCLR